MNRSIILKHLNDNKKVFVHSYNHFSQLFEVTKVNIDSFSIVDISDEMLDDESYKSTHEERVDYFTNVMKQDEIVNMLKKNQLTEYYHIDSSADVYIVEQKVF